MHRRAVIKTLSVLAGSYCIPLPAYATLKKRFRIGACDWSIGRANQPAAMQTAREIGLDGVQVSLGSVANNMHLREPAVQALYQQAAAAAGVSIAGLAIGELNNIPYKSDPRTEQWVSDSIDVASTLGCKVVLLAFFGNGDLKNDAAGQQEVIHRLRQVAPKAEKAGIYLGIESWLSAAEHMTILDAVGSSHVKVYYDVANAHKMGYDIYQEIRWLGKNICEFHAKEYGQLLGKGPIDFRQVHQAMEDIGYRGWLQIEDAVPPGATMLESYQANQAFLRTVFPE